MASSNSSQKKPFQRCCPICSNVISVRRHFCNCGHSFIDEKRKGDVEREEKYKEMGRRAAKHQNLCRSFKAMKKSVSKLQGGGYQVAVIYFKVGNRNTTKGMLPGSGLSSKNVNNLTELFYLAYMQDNGSSVNKIPTNNIDAQEDINISEAKEKNGEQELKLKKMKKKRRLSEDSTIKGPMASTVLAYDVLADVLGTFEVIYMEIVCIAKNLTTSHIAHFENYTMPA
nr:uncharacterized protein LOC123753386 isoform X4 [Procambarus clarkii]